MLPALLNTPKSDEDWNRWSFDHREEVNRINAAILAKYNQNLPDQQLYPIPWNDVNDWLERVQISHQLFNAALGQQANDLEDVDFKDPKQRESWTYLCYLECFDAEQALGI